MSNLKENETPEIRGNVIFRQELDSLTPDCGIKCAFICNIVLIIVFLGFGIPIAIATNDNIENIVSYTSCNSATCEYNLEVKVRMPEPVYVYYEIHNFYMNHRDFVKSRDFGQMRGEYNINVKDKSFSRCEGAQYMYEMFDNDTSKYKSYTNKILKGEDFANPCGLIAKSFFNDTYLITETQKLNNGSTINSAINIDETNIANNYDKNYMFKNHINNSDLQWMDYTNEHFMVWMQMESFPNFRKLWGRIEKTLEPGNYKVNVQNNYNVTLFGGEKILVLTTSNVVGTSAFFGYTLIVAACYCTLVLIIILVLFYINKDKKYDYSALKWT